MRRVGLHRANQPTVCLPFDFPSLLYTVQRALTGSGEQVSRQRITAFVDWDRWASLTAKNYSERWLGPVSRSRGKELQPSLTGTGEQVSRQRI
jgi:hypothetical protein